MFCVNVQFSYPSEWLNDKEEEWERIQHWWRKRTWRRQAMSARPPARSCYMLRKRELFLHRRNP